MRQKFKLIFSAAISCLSIVSILAGITLFKLREGVELRKQASFAQSTLDDVLESLQQAHIYHLRAQISESPAEEARATKEIRKAEESFHKLLFSQAAKSEDLAPALTKLDALIDSQIANVSYSGMDSPLSPEIRNQIDYVDGLLEDQVNAHQLFVNKYFGLNIATLGFALLFTIALLFIFALLVSDEIRRRALLEVELRKAQAAAVSASNLKSQFVATVSHEIRTPLNGIIGMSELVRDLVQGPELRRYAEILHRSGQNLLRIVNDILDFSKIEANRFEFEMEEVRPARIIESAVELFAKKAAEKKLAVIGDYDGALNRTYVTDGSRIAQIVHNLLGNGIKFTENGVVQVLGSIDSQSDQRVFLRFDVIDTGRGFSDEERQHLFKPFNQLENARNQEGTGLGLTICKRLVENMGGQIEVTSKVGEGSHFWFKVPVQILTKEAEPKTNLVREVVQRPRAVGVGLPVQFQNFLKSHREDLAVDYLGDSHWPTDFTSKDVVLVRESMALLNPQISSAPCVIRVPEQITPERLNRALSQGLQRSLLPESNSAQGPTESALLLLVEDNATNQILAQALLEGMGFRVHVASNGEEALEAMIQVHYGLILMDCRMPVMDGFAATKKIREREQAEGLERVPIVAMTANATEADREKCLQSGMDDYLVKPFDPSHLATKVKLWIRVGAPAVDWNVARQLATRTNNEIVRRLMESMVMTLSSNIPKLELSQKSSDWSGISGIAHQLKSSSATVGALRFAEFCESVEGEIDRGAVPSDEQLKGMIHSAQQVLDEIRSRRIFK